jgi:thiol-disulfide isomerase/thioredoxin
MKKVFIFLLMLLFFPRASFSQQTVFIRGKVLGHDGLPMKKAFAYLHGQGMKSRTIPDDDGAYSFGVEKTGGYFLWFAGVHHKTVLIPVFLEQGQNIGLTVRLSAAAYEASFDSILVIGEFNDFDAEAGSIPMQKHADGTFSVTVEAQADSFKYQLIGVQENKVPISGTYAHAYAFDRSQPIISDRSGKFISIIRTDSGKVLLPFDPQMLPRSARKARFVFQNPASASAKIIPIHNKLKEAGIARFAALRKHRAAGNPDSTFRYDLAGIRKYIRERINSEKNTIVKHYLLLNYFKFADFDKDSSIARRVFSEIRPDSRVWSLIWPRPRNTFQQIARLANQPEIAERYAETASRTNSNDNNKASFLFYLLDAAHQRRDSTAIGKLFSRMINEFGESSDARIASMLFAPNRKILVGKEVPDFSFPLLDDASKIITRESLYGRVYLLDFWAVWCKPCVAEMENLHKAYKKYKERGFTILSISFDDKASHVMRFRKAKWPMPWLNVFLQDGFASETAKNFEVVAIPKPILVDAQGKIRATEAMLRGKNLDATLATIFQDEQD